MKLRNRKTGHIGNFDIECIKERGDFVKVVANDVPYYEIKEECGNLYYYDTLEEFNEEWEEYKPKEPLIKNEKIRKAVKAWAEVNGIKKIIVFDCGNNAPYTPVGAVDFAENSSHLEIRFRTEERFDTDRIYTIAELCGEEEDE